MSSTRTGARDSMPSTAIPSAILPSSSPSSGWRLGQRGGPGPHLVGQQQLAAGRRPQAVLGDLQRALVGDLEVADLLDVVAPELHPQRVLLGGREHVEDAAADRELAALLDQLDPGVRGGRQALDDLVQVGALPAAQGDGLQVAEPLDLRLEHGADRRDDDRDRAGRRVVVARVGQPAQHREPPAHGVAARREPLVRQRLPGRVLRRPRPGGSSERSAAARSSASRPVAVTASTGRPASRASAATREGAGGGRADQVDVRAVAVGGGLHRFGERGVSYDGVEQTVQAHEGIRPGEWATRTARHVVTGRGLSSVRRPVPWPRPPPAPLPKVSARSPRPLMASDVGCGFVGAFRAVPRAP